MNGETLYHETDYFYPFPDASDVFANNVDQHLEYLIPLASVELSHLWPDLKGRIHFVCPIEPFDDEVGDGTDEYHNYLCRKNWVGYRMLGDKCELACDFRYFKKAYYAENPPDGMNAKISQEYMQPHYEKVRKGFALRETHFREHGCLHHAWSTLDKHSKYSHKDRVNLVYELGGTSGDGNWVVGDFPITYGGEYTDDDGDICEKVCPQTEDGRDFNYIGSITVSNYLAESPDFTGIHDCDLLLFYDPRSNVALTTMNWS